MLLTPGTRKWMETGRGVTPGGGAIRGLIPPRINEIYGFQRVFRPKRLLSPSWKEKKILKPPYLVQFLCTPLETLYWKLQGELKIADNLVWTIVVDLKHGLEDWFQYPVSEFVTGNRIL